MDDEEQKITDGTPVASAEDNQPVIPEADSADDPDVQPSEESPKKLPPHHRLREWYASHKKLSIPATVLVLILLLAAIPWSRYHAAGLVIKKDVRLKISDSTANTPVSEALITTDGISGTTDGNGVVTLHGVKVGSHKFTVTKKYYKDRSFSYLVPIASQKNMPVIAFEATGRQVKIVVSDLVSHKKLTGVDINIDDQKYTTDKNGEALVVLPADGSQKQASLSDNGYNDAAADLQVSTDNIKENDIKLTPAGKVYFLSKLSGKIDVVKTNLDGSDRKTILAGTGKEDDRTTVLLASRDWKYLALYARRDSDNNKLYVINTSDDSVIPMDQTNGSYTVIGWSDNNFIYTVDKGLQPWQPHSQVLKSYNATSGQILILDQTNAQGTDNSDYANESYGSVYAIGKTVIYEKNWNAYYYNHDVLNDKQGGIYSIGANGSAPTKLKTFGYQTNTDSYVSSVPSEADEIYFSVKEKDVTSYYAYANGKLTTRSDIADDINNYYSKPQITYLLSPSAAETFWADERDGKQLLFLGDQHGENGKQLAPLGDLSTYGWFSNDYLLVSKNGSELYIMPREGITDTIQPVKISDYHKPATNFPGYGGGYGGI